MNREAALERKVHQLTLRVIALKAKELWTRQHGVVIYKKIPVAEIARHTGFGVEEVTEALRNDPHFDEISTPVLGGYVVSFAYSLRGYDI